MTRTRYYRLRSGLRLAKRSDRIRHDAIERDEQHADLRMRRYHTFPHQQDFLRDLDTEAVLVLSLTEGKPVAGGWFRWSREIEDFIDPPLGLSLNKRVAVRRAERQMRALDAGRVLSLPCFI